MSVSVSMGVQTYANLRKWFRRFFYKPLRPFSWRVDAYSLISEAGLALIAGLKEQAFREAVLVQNAALGVRQPGQ